MSELNFSQIGSQLRSVSRVNQEKIDAFQKCFTEFERILALGPSRNDLLRLAIAWIDAQGKNYLKNLNKNFKAFTSRKRLVPDKRSRMVGCQNLELLHAANDFDAADGSTIFSPSPEGLFFLFRDQLVSGVARAIQEMSLADEETMDGAAQAEALTFLLAEMARIDRELTILHEEADQAGIKLTPRPVHPTEADAKRFAASLIQRQAENAP